MNKSSLMRWGFRAAVVSFAGGAPLAVLIGLSTIPSCPRMREQSRLKPYEKNDFFDDHSTVRHPPAGTISRSRPINDAPFLYGRQTLGPLEASERRPIAQQPLGQRPTNPWPTTPPATMTGVDTEPTYVDEFPIKVTRATLQEGRERFGIYCTPCHGAAGYGNGVVTYNGFPNPPSYHTDRLRQAPVGYLYAVISNGFGQMYSYASRLKPAQRWAVVAYVRTLQYSQYVPAADLDAHDRRTLQEAPR